MTGPEGQHRSTPAFLDGGGKMGARIRSFAWEETPLGEPDGWPPSLQTAVGIMLGAAAPIAVYWGADLHLLYNDPWRALIGDKHPGALGRPARAVFPEIWQTLAPQMARVLADREAVLLDGQSLLLDRDGQLEEAWFDYTFNPIPRGDGSVGGIFNIASEVTDQVRAGAARKESERRLRQVSQAASLGTYMRDLRTGEDYWSPEFLALYGLAPGEPFPLEEGIAAMVHPEDRPQVLAEARARQGRTGDGHYSSEHRIIRPDGAIRWVLVQGEMTFGPDGQPEAVYGVALDITERRRAQENSRRNERLLQAILEQMPSGVHVAEAPSGRHLFHNQELERLLGHPPVLSRKEEDYAHYGAVHLEADGSWRPYRPDEYPMLRALQGEEIRQEEMRYRRGDGRLITLDVNAAPIRDSAGAIARAVVTFHDISEFKRVQEALALMNETLEEKVEMRTRQVRAQEERYRTLFESIDEGFCIFQVLFDEAGKAVDLRFLEVNPAFEKQSGLTKVVGRRMSELGVTLERDWYEIYEHVARTGEPCRFTKRARALGDRWYDVYAFRVDEPAAHRVAILFNDITLRKHAEEQIRELAAQLTLAEHEERGRIAEILHDDLQQQLYAVQIKLALVEAQAEREPLLAEIAELDAMLEQITDTARGLSMDLSPPILEGEGLVQAFKWLADRMGSQYGLVVGIDVQDGDGAGTFPVADRDRRVLLFRTLRELLFNAVKHAGVDRVEVRLKEANGYYRIEVLDEGSGFDPAYALTPGTSPAGRGLLHSRQRLQLVGGSLKVESAPGAGTRIVITTPATDTAEAA